MSETPFFICDCGSTVLAISHTWTKKRDMEEVGHADGGGGYVFDKPAALAETEIDHEWIAYCGGCGQGVTVEWLDDNRIKVLLEPEHS